MARANRFSGADPGTSVVSARLIISAITGRALLEAVRVEYGDSELPRSAGAFGSAQTASVTASLLAACTKLKRSVLTMARRLPDSPLKGRKLAELEARDGGLYYKQRRRFHAMPLTQQR